MTAEARRLQQLVDRLDAGARQTLVDFAEFLAARAPDKPPPPTEPLDIPRVAGESVIAALRRLRKTYPMLDATRLLDSAATGMTRHVLQGEEADTVIDGLEKLFTDAYAAREKSEVDNT